MIEYGSRTYFLNTWSSISGQEKHSLTENPLFVNVENYDFHLQSASPCIDKGTITGLTLDYDDNQIPYGNAPDIGAYEYQETTVGN